jgi:hypothetical protein
LVELASAFSRISLGASTLVVAGPPAADIRTEREVPFEAAKRGGNASPGDCVHSGFVAHHRPFKQRSMRSLVFSAGGILGGGNQQVPGRTVGTSTERPGIDVSQHFYGQCC